MESSGSGLFWLCEVGRCGYAEESSEVWFGEEVEYGEYEVVHICDVLHVTIGRA